MNIVSGRIKEPGCSWRPWELKCITYMVRVNLYLRVHSGFEQECTWVYLDYIVSGANKNVCKYQKKKA